MEQKKGKSQGGASMTRMEEALASAIVIAGGDGDDEVGDGSLVCLSCCDALDSIRGFGFVCWVEMVGCCGEGLTLLIFCVGGLIGGE